MGNIGDRNGFWDLDYVGGIVGNNSGTVRYCVNSGDINSNGDGTGGIVGLNGDDVYYCFNNGTVNGDEAAGTSILVVAGLALAAILFVMYKKSKNHINE